jgi:antitoxin HicB
MLIHPVHFKLDTNGTVLVSFRDILEAVTFGDDATEAKSRAADTLIAMFSENMDDRQIIPNLSPIKDRTGAALPIGVGSTVLLWNAMLEAGMRKADLAQKLNLSPTVIDRMLNLRHACRIEQIQSAMAALGKRLVIGVLQAA